MVTAKVEGQFQPANDEFFLLPSAKSNMSWVGHTKKKIHGEHRHLWYHSQETKTSLLGLVPLRPMYWKWEVVTLHLMRDIIIPALGAAGFAGGLQCRNVGLEDILGTLKRNGLRIAYALRW